MKKWKSFNVKTHSSADKLLSTNLLTVSLINEKNEKDVFLRPLPYHVYRVK